MKVGYCTNVHAGTSLEAVKNNLLEHAVAVRNELLPTVSNKLARLPVGLWLSNQAAMELQEQELVRWRDWFVENKLLPYTFNGFPYNDFHQAVVKHNVYLPTWAEPDRLSYTVKLARVLDAILPDSEVGTISTLPLGWPPKGMPDDLTGALDTQSDAFLLACAKQLKQLVIELDRILQVNGRLIKVGIEPEPGCVLDSANDVAIFFQRYLFDDSNAERVRRHLGVCHDVCHSAVMFESQQLAIETYREAGIDICKVQVSSAIEGVFDGQRNEETWQALQGFVEQKYLHQTCLQNTGSNLTEFFEDLHVAIKQKMNGERSEQEDSLRGSMRVHFHVPIFMEKLGVLNTTQSQIAECLTALRQNQAGGNDVGRMPHFEVETYAWNVLPDQYQGTSLASGIAKEIRWFTELLDR